MYVEKGDIGYTFKKDSDSDNGLILLDAKFCNSTNINTSLLEIPEVVLFDRTVYKVTKVASRSLDRIKNLFKEIRFPNSIIEIPVYCFYDCNKVEKLIFGSGITKIPSCFAYNASNLREVIFSNNLESIDSNAFSKTRLKKLILPPSLKKIGQFAFYECGELSEIIFPESLEYLGFKAFIGCRSFQGNIHFQGPPPKSDLCGSKYYRIFPHHMKRENNTFYVKSKFINDFISDSGFRRSTILVEEQKYLELEFKHGEILLIPKLDKSGRNYYSGEIRVPKTVMYDGKLKNIDKIEDFAFSSCPELKSVILPAGIKLGNNVFFNSPQCKIEYEYYEN